MANRPFTDPFAVLGLPPTASREDVKRAFRLMALKCHPDVDPSPQAAARFTEVKRAADSILQGQRQAAASWRAYAEGVTRAAPEVHDSLRVLRSRSAALWFCGASLVAGFGIFYFAMVSHEWLDGYRWLTPAAAESRLKHPNPRRQQLAAMMLQQPAARGVTDLAGAGEPQAASPSDRGR